MLFHDFIQGTGMFIHLHPLFEPPWIWAWPRGSSDAVRTSEPQRFECRKIPVFYRSLGSFGKLTGLHFLSLSEPVRAWAVLDLRPHTFFYF